MSLERLISPILFPPVQPSVSTGRFSSKSDRSMRKLIQHRTKAVLLLLAMFLASVGYAADRTVQALDLSLSRGETNRLFIVLESQGDENTVDFSLCYDPTQLSFIEAVRGADATNASAVLSIDTAQTLSGQLGLTITLPSGEVFNSSGTKVLIEVLFQATLSTTNLSTQVALCGQPVASLTLDTNSTPLTTSYVGATVTFLDPCVYSLTAHTASSPASGGSNTVAITTGNSCMWSVVTGTNWITIDSAAHNTN